MNESLLWYASLPRDMMLGVSSTAEYNGKVYSSSQVPFQPRRVMVDMGVASEYLIEDIQIQDPPSEVGTPLVRSQLVSGTAMPATAMVNPEPCKHCGLTRDPVNLNFDSVKAGGSVVIVVRYVGPREWWRRLARKILRQRGPSFRAIIIGRILES